MANLPVNPVNIDNATPQDVLDVINRANSDTLSPLDIIGTLVTGTWNEYCVLCGGQPDLSLSLSHSLRNIASTGGLEASEVGRRLDRRLFSPFRAHHLSSSSPSLSHPSSSTPTSDLPDPAAAVPFAATAHAPDPEEKDTWSPLSTTDVREFHRDLVAIGCWADGEDEDEDDGDGDGDGRRRWDDTDVALLTGLVPMDSLQGELFIRDGVARRFPGSYIARHADHHGHNDYYGLDTGGDGHGEEHGRQEETGRPITAPTVFVKASSGTYMLHARCWELLAALFPHYHSVGPLPPSRLHALLYRASSLLPAHPVTLPHQHPPLPWIDYGLTLAAQQQLFFQPLALLPRSDSSWATKLGERMRSAKVDRNWKESLWTEAGAWVWARMDRFPLEQAFFHPPQLSTFPPRSPASSFSSSSSHPFLRSLPPELLRLVSLHLPILSFLHLASSCTSLRHQTLPFADEVARRTAERDKPWVLPWTERERTWWDGEVRRLSELTGSRATATAKERRRRRGEEEGEEEEEREESPLPLSFWLAYLRASSNPDCWEMRNRRRVWAISRQLAYAAERLSL